MPRLSEETRLKRREDIAEAALRCFRRNGVANTSIADIIEESGLSAGSIYSHFTNKAEVVHFTAHTLLGRRAGGLLAAAEADPAGLAPGALLRTTVTDALPRDMGEILIQLWSGGISDPELASVVAGALNEARGMLMRALSTWVAAHSPRGASAQERLDRAGRLADVILSCAHGFVLRRALDPEADIDTILDDLVATVDAAAARD